MADQLSVPTATSSFPIQSLVAEEGSPSAARSGSSQVFPWVEADRHDSAYLLKHRLRIPFTDYERTTVDIVERARPTALRVFDQIPMRKADLLRQAKIVGPSLAGKRVAFVGDMDGTAMLIGLLTIRSGAEPSRMIVLDFDDRVLATTLDVASRHGFSHLIEVRRYNVFDAVPSDLVGKWDSFYTNPPYGSNNRGASARLFITRGCELTGPTEGTGCIIVPDDPSRPWTRGAMLETQRFLIAHGWIVREKLDQLHRYHLDDDRELASALMLVDRVGDGDDREKAMTYEGRKVAFDEIPLFYGRSAQPPYPRYITLDGVPVYESDWTAGA